MHNEIFPAGGSEDLAWIDTLSGAQIFPAMMLSGEDFHIADIARGLSRIPRWLGQTTEKISVAQHSVLVAQTVVAPADRLWGLLHDAHEAYLGDVPHPLLVFFPRYKELAENIQGAICRKFGLPPQQPATVTYADQIVRNTEARDLRPRLGRKVRAGRDHVDTMDTLDEPIQCWPEIVAERLFLKAFETYGGAR